jgi:four helix bundle protein
MIVYDDEVIAQIVHDQNHQYNRDLRERLLDFAVSVIKMLGDIDKHREFDVIKYQLSKSATSIGANYEEAQSSSYKEFAQKTRISLREANESKYWLKIIANLDLLDKRSVKTLILESEELSKILGSIVSKVHKKLK